MHRTGTQLLVWLGLLAGVLALPAARPAPSRLRGTTVYVFLAQTCPISQQATLSLRELYARYAGQGVRFVGVFPERAAMPAALAAWARTYQLPFELRPDPALALTHRLKATTTPEAVVLAPDGQTVRYQGRLDDQYAALGERRTVSRHHELAEALADLAAGRPVAAPRTEPIGCYIELAGQ